MKIANRFSKGVSSYFDVQCIKLTSKELKWLPYFQMHNYKMVYCNKDAIYLSHKTINQGYFVGTSAIIRNANDCVLLVQEKNGLMRGMWGFPSGLVDHGESISQGMIREVKEETSLEITSYELVQMRSIEQTKWGRPDLLFYFNAQVKNTDCARYCRSELMGMQWIPIQELQNFRLKEQCTQASQFGLDLLQEEKIKSLQKLSLESMNIYLNNH